MSNNMRAKSCLTATLLVAVRQQNILNIADILL